MDFASEWAFVDNDEEEAEMPRNPLPPPPAAAAAPAYPFAAAGAPPPPPRPEARGRRNVGKLPAQPRMDVNVLSIKLGELATKADAAVETGDPQYCSSCHAALVSADHVLFKQDKDDIKKSAEIGNVQDDDQKKQFAELRSKLQDGEALWNCEFCGAINVLTLDKEEIPKIAEGSLDFILEPPEVQEPGADDSKVEGDKESKRIIFCVDVSGSMCVSQQAPGSLKVKGREAEEDPFSFLPADDPDLIAWRQMQGHNPKTTWVTRLEAVQAAVESQIEALAKEHPNYIVGLVSFESDVTIWGDGKSSPAIIAGGKLHKDDEIMRAAKDYEFSTPVSESKDALLKKLFSLKDKGQTALGPGLVASVSLASAKSGSKVILCTDGLANIGVGAIPESGSVREWYKSVGTRAADAGVTISVISITDEHCSLENLGEVADLTGGSVERVNPLDLAKNLQGILSNEVLATSVSATMILHHGLEFRNLLDGEHAQKGFNAITKDIGNVFQDTEVFFEYQTRKKEMAKFKHLSSLPFQVQIIFTRLDGAKCARIITRRQKLTLDRKKAQKNVKVDVIAANAAQLSAVHARRGSFVASKMVHDMNFALMEEVAQDNVQRAQVAQYSSAMSGLNAALDNLVQVEAAQESEDFSDFSFAPPPPAAPAAAAPPSFSMSGLMNRSAAPPAPAAAPSAKSRSRVAEAKSSGSSAKANISDDVASEIFKLKKSNRSKFS
eukprot:TRINITY_DN6417_c0_g1_i1.p1 TRINITY_DN6417_c0_g1~~TRINITY_DN6417_c0_g1_i1.p1  ORF type:complete len:723 (-),score=215.14 TRINITY_DN6417_c0_g1_i1:50-2218(-)